MSQRTAVIALALACSLWQSCSKAVDETSLYDRVKTVADDMRWKKQPEGRASVPLHFPAPVLVLALPPGTYSAERLESLLPTPKAAGHLLQWAHGRAVRPDRPAIYIVPARGGEVAFFPDYTYVSIPAPIARWKVDEKPLEIDLRRIDDRVDVIALQ